MQDGTLCSGSRGDSLQRLWRGAGCYGPGRVFLEPRGAYSTCYRLGYPLSPRFRVGILSGSGTNRSGTEECHGGSVSQFVFKLPDLGEGTVEAEIVAWHVKPGDVVSEDDVIVEVMTEKAAVELPSPVSGRVVSTTGGPGDMVPVGAALIVFDTEAGEAAAPAKAESAVPAKGAGGAPVVGAASAAARAVSNGAAGPAHVAAHQGRVATSPAIRRRAHEAGVDLRNVPGTGPNGRIVRGDFDAYLE